MLYCQKCQQHVDPDTTIEDLNPASFDLLVGKAQQHNNSLPRLNYPQERKDLYDRVSTQATSPVYKRTIPAPQDESTINLRTVSDHGPRAAPPDMSFIEITQSQAVLPDKDVVNGQKRSPKSKRDGDSGEDKKKYRFSTDVEKAQVLYEVLSSRSDVDHPICAECTSLLLASFSARLGSTNRERDAYASFLKSVQQTVSSTTSNNDSKAAKTTADAQKTGQSTFDHLKRTEGQSQTIEKDIGKLEEEMQQAELEEQAYWSARNAIDDQLHETTVRLLTLQEKYTHDRQQLERLQRTNVYNDTFCISHDGSFGTINGLRLGRLPNQTVDWTEINAAWGQAILLLATVAERLRYSFQGYRLRPQGSTSRIDKLEYPQQSPSVVRQSTAGQDRGLQSAAANPEPKVTVLDLFSSGDMAIGRMFNHRRFDNGMVAFLDCISQLARYIQRTSKVDLKTTPSKNATSRNAASKNILPYEIDDDKIGNVSIKLGVGFSQDENFTKACKYALTCCKYLLAYVSNVEVQGLAK
ncbi:Vacuolar protein sorting-associated protein atg6 [Exophiala xenobiotica]|nr:Vacuolar protein sorting-associated protein atg6 [Exophiala xenobiotica]KAK5250934.1 Vacuolar protein sorting-associated protein atg6 [Exophiala xenobiotica]KAK5355605.1 Vacuolar protein sorting-associated protein atg6 [Exophiala xenobiotica]KAK5385498.1 Vacuolar protein sorting-associated protein atg6 [Exophiala xenobiotica]KAK5386570.1 Vacuolar protein sorting-associated protein atg6 [Exophiala xenobiotica]